MAAPEKAEARLARMEAMLESLIARQDEWHANVMQLLGERCENRSRRIEKLETSVRDQGERIGRLEAGINQARGGWWAVSKLMAGAAVAGGLASRIFDGLR